MFSNKEKKNPSLDLMAARQVGFTDADLADFLGLGVTILGMLSPPRQSDVFINKFAMLLRVREMTQPFGKGNGTAYLIPDPDPVVWARHMAKWLAYFERVVAAKAIPDCPHLELDPECLARTTRYSQPTGLPLALRIYTAFIEQGHNRSGAAYGGPSKRDITAAMQMICRTCWLGSYGGDEAASDAERLSMSFVFMRATRMSMWNDLYAKGHTEQRRSTVIVINDRNALLYDADEELISQSARGRDAQREQDRDSKRERDNNRSRHKHSWSRGGRSDTRGGHRAPDDVHDADARKRQRTPPPPAGDKDKERRP